MPSVYSPRWTAPEESAPSRHCDAPGCTHHGEFKAPKHRKSADMRDYHYFCLDHVKHYNQNWNYFSGMPESEVEAFWRETYYGNRPTWQRDGVKFNRERLTEEVYRSFADYLAGGEAKYAGGQQQVLPVDRATQKALAVLDLDWPVTEKDVKQRYKILVKQYHPDVNQSEAAGEYFKAVTEAYQQLKAAIKKETA